MAVGDRSDLGRYLDGFIDLVHFTWPERCS